MSENKIIGMLGDIRIQMFDILGDNKELLEDILKVIDDKMELYRGKSDAEIIAELKGEQTDDECNTN